MFGFGKRKKAFSQEVGAFAEKPRLQYLLPWAFVDSETGIVHGKDHSMLAVYEFRGPDMESATALDLVQYNAALNNVIKTLPTGYVLYFEAQRRLSTEYDASEVDIPIIQKMENDRRAYYAEQTHFETRYYFTVYLEPPQLIKSRLTDAFIADAKSEGKSADMRLYVEVVEKFIANVNLIGDMLKSWFPDLRPLSAEEVVTFLHTTISDKNHRVRVNPQYYITDYICDAEALTMKGSHGKLFDNSKDVSGTGFWQVYEMETLMATPSIVPATLEYLFHRIESKIRSAKGPSIIVLDECWLFFDNPIFKEKLREYFKDMRKKNTSIIFATQNLSDLANKPELLHTVMENCPNRVYLPNKQASTKQSKELYTMFNCNDRQVEIIANMTPKQDYYYSSEKGNRIFRLALRPIEIPFVTATSKNDQQAIDQILAAMRKDSFIEDWLTYKNAEDELIDYKENYARCS